MEMCKVKWLKQIGWSVTLRDLTMLLLLFSCRYYQLKLGISMPATPLIRKRRNMCSWQVTIRIHGYCHPLRDFCLFKEANESSNCDASLDDEYDVPITFISFVKFKTGDFFVIFQQQKSLTAEGHTTYCP